MNDKLLLPVSIIIAGILIGSGFLLSNKNKNTEVGTFEKRQQELSKSISGVMRPVDQNDHILGSPNARIILVEYSDTECAFCKIFHTTMLAIMRDYGSDERVAWVYRHFPITEIHKKSMREAEAQECAAALGGNSKFWEYTNKLYEVTPSNDGLDPLELEKIAVDVGLSSVDFKVCLDSGEFRARIEADINNAKELGAIGTPYSVLLDTKTGDKYPIEGAYPYSQLKQVIDMILQS